MSNTELKLTWKPAPTNLGASGERLYLGRWHVGGTFYNSCRGQGDKNVWVAACRLLGIKDIIGHFVTIEEAKEAVEKAVKHWMKGTNDEPPK